MLFPHINLIPSFQFPFLTDTPSIPLIYHKVLKHTALSQGAGDYSKFNQGTPHHIKRHLLLGIKAMTNLDSILKGETLLCQQRSI